MSVPYFLSILHFCHRICRSTNDREHLIFNFFCFHNGIHARGRKSGTQFSEGGVPVFFRFFCFWCSAIGKNYMMGNRVCFLLTFVPLIHHYVYRRERGKPSKFCFFLSGYQKKKKELHNGKTTTPVF